MEEKMIIFSDTGHHVIEGDTLNLKVCPRGHWNQRMIFEIVFSMMAKVGHFKNEVHR